MRVRKHSVKVGFLLAAGIAVAVLSGCTPGPAYVRPSVAVPAHYKESVPPQGWVAAQPSDAADRGQWWKAFGDSTLDALEARVEVGNQNIQKSVANLKQARAMIGVARSSYFPQVTARTAAAVDHTSKNVLGHS